MDYLLLMTAAGSALFLGYLCWARLCGPFLTQRMKYRALAAVLLVYLMPWVWLREVCSSLSGLAAGAGQPAGGEMPVSFAEIMAEGEAYRTGGYWLLTLVRAVWLCGMLFSMARKLIEYASERKLLLGAAKEPRDGSTWQVAGRIREELRYRRSLEIVETPGKNRTFTIGALKPVIFLQKEYGPGDLAHIIKHEMVHISRGDLVAKLLLEAVCCLHWFNPLVRVALRGQFDLVCETSCDERVTRGYSDEERKAYAKLLIDSICDGEPKAPLSSALDCDLKNTEERVNLIMENKNVKAWKKMVAAGVFALMLGLNSLTAFAYPDVYHIQEIQSEAVKPTVSGDGMWLYDAGEEHNIPTDVILYPEQFIDETGEIYPVYSSHGIICTLFGHNIVSGYFQTHEDNGDGGCTVKTYESTRCTICNSIWVGEKINTVIWTVCPH